MRILHTSDWHLGRSFHREGMLTHQAAYVDHLLDGGRARAGRPGGRRRATSTTARSPRSTPSGWPTRRWPGWPPAARQVVLTSGNHDSAQRLGFSSRLIDAAGVFIRTDAAHRRHPGAARRRARRRWPSTASPTSTPTPSASPGGCPPAPTRPRSTRRCAGSAPTWPAAAPGTRSVVLAHAFVAGAAAERLRARHQRRRRLAGADQHLRRRRLRRARPPARPPHPHRRRSATPARRSPTPSPRPTRQGLLAGRPRRRRADARPSSSRRRSRARWPGSAAPSTSCSPTRGSASHESAWVQATLTDDVRPLQAMERLRARFPHTLVLGFEPAGGDPAAVPAGAHRRGAPTTTSRSTSSPSCAARRPTDAESRAAPGRVRRVLRGPRGRRARLRARRGRPLVRLHHLEATAFGPFAETVDVDFDQLSAAGLFLLSGPTGAGKTSVLDAVCFALYGDVPGDRNTAKRLRSDQAAPGVRPQVVLEATLSGRRFRIARSPVVGAAQEARRRHHHRAGLGHDRRARRRRLGHPLHPARRDRPPGHRGCSGMNLAQFTQVAMLPQGRFQAFLRARSEERHRLLQQLFRTGRFEDVERWLRDRRLDLRARRPRPPSERVADLVSRVSEATGAPAPDGPARPAEPGPRDGSRDAATGTAPTTAARAAAAAAEPRGEPRRAVELEAAPRAGTSGRARVDAAARPSTPRARAPPAERPRRPGAGSTPPAAPRRLSSRLAPASRSGRQRRALGGRRRRPRPRRSSTAPPSTAPSSRPSRPRPGPRPPSSAHALDEPRRRAALRPTEQRRGSPPRSTDPRSRASRRARPAPTPRGPIAVAELAARIDAAAQVLARGSHGRPARRRSTAALTRGDSTSARRGSHGMAAEMAGGLVVGGSCPVCGSCDHPHKAVRRPTARPTSRPRRPPRRPPTTPAATEHLRDVEPARTPCAAELGRGHRARSTSVPPGDRRREPGPSSALRSTALARPRHAADSRPSLDADHDGRTLASRDATPPHEHRARPRVAAPARALAARRRDEALAPTAAESLAGRRDDHAGRGRREAGFADAEEAARSRARPTGVRRPAPAASPSTSAALAAVAAVLAEPGADEARPQPLPDLPALDRPTTQALRGARRAPAAARTPGPRRADRLGTSRRRPRRGPSRPGARSTTTSSSSPGCRRSSRASPPTTGCRCGSRPTSSPTGSPRSSPPPTSGSTG